MAAYVLSVWDQLVGHDAIERRERLSLAIGASLLVDWLLVDPLLAGAAALGSASAEDARWLAAHRRERERDAARFALKEREEELRRRSRHTSALAQLARDEAVREEAAREMAASEMAAREGEARGEETREEVTPPAAAGSGRREGQGPHGGPLGDQSHAYGSNCASCG